MTGAGMAVAGKLVARDLDYGLLDPKRDFCVQGFHQSLSRSLLLQLKLEILVLMVVVVILQVLFWTTHSISWEDS